MASKRSLETKTTETAAGERGLGQGEREEEKLPVNFMLLLQQLC